MAEVLLGSGVMRVAFMALSLYSETVCFEIDFAGREKLIVRGLSPLVTKLCLVTRLAAKLCFAFSVLNQIARGFQSPGGTIARASARS